MTRSSIRIKGLVSLMNHVREQLRVGVPADQQDDFRAMVADGLRAVETVCRQHHITPEDLPSPSRRAYRYLKQLDLDTIPTPSAGEPTPPVRVQVSGVVSSCNWFHTELARVASVQATWTSDDPEVVRLAAKFRADADAIAGLCQDEGGTPAGLPTRSRRGYQWLVFLSDPENLALHLETLSMALAFGRQPEFQQGLTARQRDLPLNIQLYVTSALYRTRIKSRRIHTVFNEGFVDAPEDVIRALVALALQSGSEEDKALVKAYGASESFREVLTTVEMITAELSDDPHGQHFDLGEVFERVNATYFKGALDRPRLTWNRTPTTRKMGHYDLLTDTVMLSMTLDDARVPDYAIDYVMYHELLHKQLGVNRVKGRRYMHTPAFRERERAFKRYDEAQVFLAKL